MPDGTREPGLESPGADESNSILNYLASCRPRLGRQQQLGIALVVLMIASPLAALAASPTNTVNPDSPAYHGEIYMQEDELTVAEHDRATMDDPSSNLQYEDDNGSVVDAEATVNSSQDNTTKVTYSHIEDTAYTTFPRVDGEEDSDDDGVGDYSWLNHANWENESTNTGASLTIADATGSPDDGVPAVEISTASVGANDVMDASYDDNVSITSDVSKRVLFVVMDINTLNSAANVTINVTDNDGDHYYAVIDTDRNAIDDMVITNQTGDGVVFQAKLTNLPSVGTVDEINATNVSIRGGDADIDIVGLDVKRKTKLDIGETMEDTDGDGDKEKNMRHEVRYGGEVGLTSLATMGTWADDAVVHNLKVNNVRWRVQDLTDADDWDIQYDEATAYPSFAVVLNASYRLEVPTPIDLSHGDVDLEINQGLVTDRYVELKVAEDTGTTDPRNVSSGSFSAVDDKLTGKNDDHIALDTSITAGNNYVVLVHTKHTQEEADSLQATSTGGAAPMDDGSGGGLLGMLFSIPGLLVGTALVLVQRVRGGFPFG